jgi:hypothetical protein
MLLSYCSDADHGGGLGLADAGGNLRQEERDDEAIVLIHRSLQGMPYCPDPPEQHCGGGRQYGRWGVACEWILAPPPSQPPATRPFRVAWDRTRTVSLEIFPGHLPSILDGGHPSMIKETSLTWSSSMPTRRSLILGTGILVVGEQQAVEQEGVEWRNVHFTFYD